MLSFVVEIEYLVNLVDVMNAVVFRLVVDLIVELEGVVDLTDVIVVKLFMVELPVVVNIGMIVVIELSIKKFKLYFLDIKFIVELG